LRSPPHVTLQSPFPLEPGQAEAAASALEGAAARQAPFGIRLTGFGRFGERVVFIDVEASENLSKIHAAVRQAMQAAGLAGKEADRPFRPHVTVAHRDLTPGAFRKAWARYAAEPFEAFFSASGLVLLRLEPEGWVVRSQFPFRDEGR
jgi:2'-5' RNA ligase